MGKTLFDVYDKAGNLIIEDMTSSEIGLALGTQSSNVSKRASDGNFIFGKYKIVRKTPKQERKNERKNESDRVKEILLLKWPDTVKPFKNVIWVNQYVPGVKRLGGRMR